MNARGNQGKCQQGASIIEIVIALAVLSILIAVAVPSFSEWINNSQIRTGAESILSGLQTARGEAVRRNANVQFTLTSPGTTGGTGWTITLVNTGEQLASAPGGEGARNVLVTPTPGGTNAVTFTGFGRTPDPPNNVNTADGSDLMTQIDIDSTVLAADLSREMRILIGSGGQIRMCDPNVTDASDPRAC
ncbi:MAG: GspH/FimT family pseudopilin [Pseudomonadota bacterium]